MSKSVLHYKRKVQTRAGPSADLDAWRDPGGPMRYRIQCLICRDAVYSRSLTWDSGNGDYHSVMRKWVIHTKTHGVVWQQPDDLAGQATEQELLHEEEFRLRFMESIATTRGLRAVFD